jgi:ATP-dependent Lon protease
MADAEFLAAKVRPIGGQRGKFKRGSHALQRGSRCISDLRPARFLCSSTRVKARFGLPSIGDPSLLADTVAPLLSTSLEQKQQLLETGDVVSRLQKLIEVMSAGRPKAVA